MSDAAAPRGRQALAIATGFLSLFSIVGFALYGLPFFYDFFVQDLSWTRQQVTSGNAVALPTAFFVREPARDEPAPGASQEGSPIREVLLKGEFYLLAVGSMCSIGAVGGAIQNLKLYLSLDRQQPQAEIATVLSLVLGGSIAGRLLMGWLADRWAKKSVMLLVYTLVALSIPLLVFAPSPALMRLFAVLFGIGLGGDYMIIPLMAAELFGVKRLGRVMGIVLTADGVAEAVVPMAVASMRDRLGSYDPGFALLVALAVAGAVAVALLPRREG